MKTLTLIELKDIDTNYGGDPLLDFKYFFLTDKESEKVEELIEQFREEWYADETGELGCIPDYIWNRFKDNGFIEYEDIDINRLTFEV